MRLLNAKTYKIHEFPGDDETRAYAILSHTWGDEECTLQHMSEPDVSARKGYDKIKYCCEQAVKEGLEWAWVDTCCIDKTSTAELSEAINSMFRWYRNAATCYAYLADVMDIRELARSRWLTRGWTLQELIAPRDVHFYSADWRYLGSKLDLQDELHRITGIDQLTLSTGVFNGVCIAKRMSWAANRQTTRVEDIASFIRLQEEIMKVSDDHTLFAWGLPPSLNPMDWSTMEPWSKSTRLHGLLADSPSDFITKYDIKPISYLQSDMPPMMFSGGVRIELPVQTRIPYQFAAISCYAHGRDMGYLGIPLFNWNGRFTARCGYLVLMSKEEWEGNKSTLLIKAPNSHPTLSQPVNVFHIPIQNEYTNLVELDEVYCPNGERYSRADNVITIPTYRKGCHLVLFFKPSADFHPLHQARFGDQFPEEKNITEKEIFGPFPFALVLGSGTRYWVTFVPILRESTTDEDFHSLLRLKGGLTKYCMTRSQLKEHLDNKKEDELFSGGKSDCFEKRLHANNFIYQRTKVVNRLHYRTDTTESWDTVLNVELLDSFVNPAEKTIFLQTEIKTIRTSRSFTSYRH